MPALRKSNKKKSTFTTVNPLSEKMGLMRHGVRPLVGATTGPLEQTKRKIDAYVKMRVEKNASYVPSSQSWTYLKDPVYFALTEHIRGLKHTIENNFYASVQRHDNKKTHSQAVLHKPVNPDSFNELKAIREAKVALKAIEERKMNQEEYEAWAKKLGAKLS